MCPLKQLWCTHTHTNRQCSYSFYYFLDSVAPNPSDAAFNLSLCLHNPIVCLVWGDASLRKNIIIHYNTFLYQVHAFLFFFFSTLLTAPWFSPPAGKIFQLVMCFLVFVFSFSSHYFHGKHMLSASLPPFVPYTLPLFRLFHLALTLPPTAAAGNASTHSDNRFDSFTSFTSCSFALCPSCSLAGRLSET